jgi:hypothetical protein
VLEKENLPFETDSPQNPSRIGVPHSAATKKRGSFLSKSADMNVGSEAISSPSTEVFMFLYSFKDLIPLILHQWYLHHISRVIRLGLLEPYPWIITHISTTEFQNDFSFAGEKQKKKAKKSDLATLASSTRVCVSFAHYRIVICLDISETVFNCTSVLTDSLLAILAEISANTKRNRRINSVQISVIAHLPEIDETWSIWQGEVTSESDVSLLQSLVRSRIERIEELSITVKALAMQGANKASSYRFPESETFLRAILFHLRLLPGDACPKAILLTGGCICIKTGPTALISQFSRDLISLNILVDLVPRDRPVGFYANICGLQLLADQTVGGSVNLVTCASPEQVIENCQKFFGHSFFNFLAFGYASNSVNAASNVRNKNADFQEGPSRMKEIGISTEEFTKHNKQEYIIKTYQCEGATVEHLLCLRLSEGFKILDVTQERENQISIHATQSGPNYSSQILRANSGRVKKVPFMTYSRQHAQQSQSVFYILTIKLEKRVSKVLNLVYQISYRKEEQLNKQSISLLATRQLNTRSQPSQLYSPTQGSTPVPKGAQAQVQGSKTHVKQSWEKAVAGEAVSAAELETLFDKIRFFLFIQVFLLF